MRLEDFIQPLKQPPPKPPPKPPPSLRDRLRARWAKHSRRNATIAIALFLAYAIAASLFPWHPFSRPYGDGWVDSAPTGQQLVKLTAGWNKIGSAARADAAFEIMKDAIQIWTGILDRRNMPKADAAKFGDYAKTRMSNPYGIKFDDNTCSGEACIRWQYHNTLWDYRYSLSFASSVLQLSVPLKYRIIYIQEKKNLGNILGSPVTAFVTGSYAIGAYFIYGFLRSFIYILLLGFAGYAGYGAYRLWKYVTRPPPPKILPPRPPPRPMPPPPPEPPRTSHGTATFAPFTVRPSGIYATQHGVFLGKSSEPAMKNAGLDAQGAPVVSRPSHHTLIVARTRTGKGTRVIVPTLLRYGHNAFVIDPKGENAAVTARARRAHLKQTVHIINPWGQLAPLFMQYKFPRATYNPLDCLDRNDPNAVATAQRLARAICPVSERGEDMFWQHNAANLLAAVFLWLTDQPGETKTLARVREIVTLSRREMMSSYLTRMAASSAFDGAIRELVGNFIDLAERTFTGITANVSIATAFISDPQLKAATNTSSFAMTDLRDKSTTLYLVIPPDQIDVQKTWLRLMITAATQSMRATAPTRKTERRCMVLIDEFPALGRLQDLPTDIATMAGYGVDYTLVVQGIDQLRAIYEKSTGAILNNCAYKWFCNVTDYEGAKYLSDILGEQTIVTETFSSSRSHGTGGHGQPTDSTRTTSSSESEKGRRLLTPDEVLALGRDVAICLQPEGRPLYLKPIDYWNLLTTFARYAGSCNPLYWDPPTSWDNNPYVN